MMDFIFESSVFQCRSISFSFSQRSHIWKKQLQHINMEMKPKGTWFNKIAVLNLPIRKQLMEDLIVHLHARVPTSMNITPTGKCRKSGCLTVDIGS